MTSRIRSLIKKHIKGKPEFSIVDESRVFCNACSCAIVIRPTSVKHCISSHSSCEAHRSNYNKWKLHRLRQLSTVDQLNAQPNIFARRFAEVLVYCGIPWKKANNPHLREFISEYCGRAIPDESWLRRYYLRPIYEKQIDLVRAEVGANWIYLQVDESVIQSRRIISVLVGVLNGQKPKSFCLYVKQIQAAPNNSIIQQTIDESLRILYPDSVPYGNIRLLVTDQAAYMLKAAQLMRSGLYPWLIHVTCLCHALHRVCEEIKSEFCQVDCLVTNFRIVMSHCDRRVSELGEFLGKAIPSLPIQTRWGTWIDFCGFINENFDAIHRYAISIQDENSNAIRKLIDELEDEDVRDDLLEIYELGPITKVIEKLEKRGLNIKEQKQLITDQREKLPERFQRKLDMCLAKNMGYKELFNLPSHQASINYLFAPMVSVDVERSFSQLKYLLNDRRTNFTEENFAMYSLVYYDANNKDI